MQYGLTNLGRCYEYGNRSGGGPEAGLRLLPPIRREGECSTVSPISAVATSTADGVEVDLKQAFNYYRRSAEKGNADGLTNLGRCYEYGRWSGGGPEAGLRLLPPIRREGECRRSLQSRPLLRVRQWSGGGPEAGLRLLPPIRREGECSRSAAISAVATSPRQWSGEWT